MIEVTTERIEALQSEAGAAGDSETVDACARALAGDKEARAECERILQEVQALHEADRNRTYG